MFFIFTTNFFVCFHFIFFIFLKFECIYFNWRLITLQYCIGFAIHQHESAMGVPHVPHPEPLSHLPPCTIPLGHPSTPAPSILYPAPRLAIHFLYDIIHVSMPFSQIIPPSPSPTQYKRLFYIRITYVDTDHVS